MPGIGKGFQHRYHLQRFRTSFVRLAARHNVPIYPMYVVNAEWVMPFHVTFPPLDRVMQRFFHVPFLPLPAGNPGAHLPLDVVPGAARAMTFVVGDPIDPWQVLHELGVPDHEEPDRSALDRAAHRVRKTMQAELDRLVARYGKRPYDWRSLAASLRAAKGCLAGSSPRDGRWRSSATSATITASRPATA